MNWTDERVELLTKLWAEGLSASQIAAQLGGVSRNAVIGKVHRLKLSGRGRAPKPVARARKVASATPAATSTSAATPQPSTATVAPTSAAAPKAAPKPSPTSTAARSSSARPSASTSMKVEFVEKAVETIETNIPDDTVMPVSRHLNLLQLTEHTCKWPIGDPMAEDFYFCGADSGDESPYCSFHSKIAFQNIGDRRRVNA